MNDTDLLRLSVHLSGRAARLESLLKLVLKSCKFSLPSWLKEAIEEALHDDNQA